MLGSLTRKNKARRGFTLIEMAIVAAITGAIAAGIFVAASSIQYRNRVNQSSDELNIIVANMRSLYGSQNTSAVASQAFSAAFDQTLITQNVFPREMVSGTVANNPWDQSVAGGTAQIGLVAAAGATPSEFIVSYINIPADACADLVTHNSLPGHDTGLVKIVIGAISYTNAAGKLPVSTIDASTACLAGGTYTINWYYNLGI